MTLQSLTLSATFAGGGSMVLTHDSLQREDKFLRLRGDIRLLNSSQSTGMWPKGMDTVRLFSWSYSGVYFTLFEIVNRKR